MVPRPQTPPPAGTLDPTSLLVLRIAVLAFTLPLCVVVVLVASSLVPGLGNPCADDPAPLLGIAIPLTLPFLYVLFRLRLWGQPKKGGWARALLLEALPHEVAYRSEAFTPSTHARRAP